MSNPYGIDSPLYSTKPWSAVSPKRLARVFCPRTKSSVCNVSRTCSIAYIRITYEQYYVRPELHVYTSFFSAVTTHRWHEDVLAEDAHGRSYRLLDDALDDLQVQRGAHDQVQDGHEQSHDPSENVVELLVGEQDRHIHGAAGDALGGTRGRG